MRCDAWWFMCRWYTRKNDGAVRPWRAVSSRLSNLQSESVKVEWKFVAGWERNSAGKSSSAPRTVLKRRQRTSARTFGARDREGVPMGGVNRAGTVGCHRKSVPACEDSTEEAMGSEEAIESHLNIEYLGVEAGAGGEAVHLALRWRSLGSSRASSGNPREHGERSPGRPNLTLASSS